MSQPLQQTESVLAEAYQYQARVYTDALNLAERLLAEWKPGQDINSALQQIMAMMDGIAKSNAAVELVKQQGLQSRHGQTPALVCALETMTRLIKRLADRIKELERLASASRDKLAPALDNVLRSRQMQRAYGAAGSFKR
jgi:hypothetical protein